MYIVLPKEIKLRYSTISLKNVDLKVGISYVSAKKLLAETYKHVLYDSATGRNVKKKILLSATGRNV
jgi:hypothetical protein